MLEQECFLTFLRGVQNVTIRRKLNEATSLNNFNDAVEYAKQLETVEKRFSAENNATEVKSILKESTVEFKKADSKTPDNSRRHRSSSNSSYDRRDRSRSRSPSNHRKSPNNYWKSYNSGSFKSNDREHSQQSQRIVKCWTCNKIGHISRNCWHNSNRSKQGPRHLN